MLNSVVWGSSATRTILRCVLQSTRQRKELARVARAIACYICHRVHMKLTLGHARMLSAAGSRCAESTA